MRRNKESKAADPERWKQWARDSYHRRKADPANAKGYLIKHAKARAAKKGLDFDLSIDDIELPEVCPILKIPFDKNTVRYAYSLDRMDPSKGYTKDNVWVISQIANAMKWDSTSEERLAFAKWVLASEEGTALCS